MITDAELLELEILLKEKFQNHVFEPMVFNKLTNEVVSNSKDLEQLVSINYPNRFKVDENKNVVLSLDLFKLLQYRYFYENETVQLVGN